MLAVAAVAGAGPLVIQALAIVASFAGIVGAFAGWILKRLEGRLDLLDEHLGETAERVAWLEGRMGEGVAANRAAKARRR